MRVIIIDNYDSFTYNLYQYIGEITHTKPLVYFNDQINSQEVFSLKPSAVIISPGPGTVKNPKDFGVSRDVILKSRIPVLGVCLGHQGIGFLSGGNVVHAPAVMHGRISKIYHTENGLFKNIPQGFEAVRYHSLMVSELPKEVIKIAWSRDNVVMGIKHATRPLWGVQFHPESIGTQFGKEILKNFFSFI